MVFLIQYNLWMGHNNKAVSFHYFCHTFKGFSLHLRFSLYIASTTGVFPIHRKIKEQMQVLWALCFWLINLWYQLSLCLLAVSNSWQKWINKEQININKDIQKHWIIFSSALFDYMNMLIVMVSLLHIII